MHRAGDLTKGGVFGRAARLGSLMATTVLMGGASAFAQEAADTAAADQEGMEQIIVSGSRLIRSGLVSPVPVTTVGETKIQASGVTNIGELLTELPSVANSSLGRTTNGGLLGANTAGANLLDLRGLGVKRTLVVVNGRRHVGASAASGEGSTAVDINAIPVELIDRVELTTGGGSVSYGADAVSGVVNIIMKDDFEGFAVDARGGISDEGDAENYYVSVTAGGNFANDRGNAVVHVTYDKNEGINDALTRSFFRNQQVLAGNPDPDGSPEFLLGDATTTPLTNIPGVILSGAGATLAQFADDGSVIPFVHGAPTGTPGRERGGDGFDLRDTYQILTPLTRKIVEGRATYELHPRITAFISGKFYNVRSFGQAQTPADIINFSGTSTPMVIAPDNPFFPAGEPLAASLLALGEPLLFSGFHLDMGRTGTRVERNSHRLVGGVEGELPVVGWSYDLYYQTGATEETLISQNERDMVKFQLAFDAVTDVAGVVPGNSPGDVACRSTVEAFTASPGGSDNPDVNGCVPVNVFGSGRFSQQALDYFLLDTVSKGRVTQNVLGGSLAGDLFQPLPAGPVGFAAGFEYREETARFDPDGLLQSDRHDGGVPTLPTSGAFQVWEGYVELAVPLLADMPLIDALNIEGGVRVSDYDSIGNTLAWRAGGDWVPVEGLRIRSVFARSVRAPNITELFSPRQGGFADIKDPCTSDQVGLGTNPGRRLANCTTLLAGLGLDPTTYQDPLAGLQQSIIVGGNPDLEEETADTLTVGAIFTPGFVPGLSITVDYFSVKIDGAIGAISPQDVVDNCVDNFDSVDNIFCRAFGRSTAPSTFGRLENVESTLFNFRTLSTRGLDYEITYGMELADIFASSGGDLGHLNLRLMGTYLMRLNETAGLNAPVNRNAGEIGRPHHRVTLDALYTRGGLAFNYTLRFIGGGNLDVDDATTSTRFEKDSAPAQTISDVQLRYRLGAVDTEFYVGINNVFDQEPPTFALPFAARNAGISEITSITAGLYDLVGRFFYAGARVAF